MTTTGVTSSPEGGGKNFMLNSSASIPQIGLQKSITTTTSNFTIPLIKMKVKGATGKQNETSVKKTPKGSSAARRLLIDQHAPKQ